ncbi:unnamed protein product [Parascedosporium putredinis]|uniref:Myb-like domain-containing protein n=1 Tax=Parascedosporium putredinis TaxID=1442378 RepID=A0A9P1MES6_9PEZI|nr:unnamed protein product [Parascedosporium putredinis]CAI8001080.1 unnamed protein product [Parascedosporium putredinis]
MRWADGHAHAGTVSPKELRRNPSPVLFANATPLAFNIPVYQSASSEPLLCFPAHDESTAAFSKRRKQEGTSSPEPLEPPIKIDKRASRNSSASIRSSGQGEPTPPREENSPGLSDGSDSDASYDGDSPRACSSSASATLEMRRLTPSCDPLGQKLSAKDEFLVRHKLQGMTYRQIRVKGGFTEAESTLRGRFRTLTKNKEARVRKPAWTEADVKLLNKAVRRYSKGKDPVAARIPWKLVAEYIVSHGGSYHFGNATCRKKWDEISFETVDVEDG